MICKYKSGKEVIFWKIIASINHFNKIKNGKVTLEKVKKVKVELKEHEKFKKRRQKVWRTKIQEKMLFNCLMNILQ